MNDPTFAISACPDVVETWAPIPGAPGYEVSDLGNVRGVDRTVHYRDGRTFHYKQRPLRPATNPVTGYRHCKLKGSSRHVHSMVLEAFVGPRPPRQECRHLNGIRTDNRLVNLAWGTPSENCYDIVRHGNSRQASQLRCLRGHKLAAPNLTAATVRNGQRGCLACDRASSTVRKALEDRGEVLDLQTVADHRYGLIMSGRPSGITPYSGAERVGTSRTWAVMSTRRGASHALSSKPGLAVCGRSLPSNAPVVTDWTDMKQCRNCARLIVAGVGHA